MTTDSNGQETPPKKYGFSEFDGGYAHNDTAKKWNEFKAWAEANKSPTIMPRNGLIVLVCIGALLVGVSRWDRGGPDKLASGDVPTATQDSAGSSASKKPCKFEGTRPFIAPRDMEVHEVVPIIAGMKKRMHECRQSAIDMIIAMNANTRPGDYAVTSFSKDERHFEPQRIKP